jgi:hypothetical protein
VQLQTAHVLDGIAGDHQGTASRQALLSLQSLYSLRVGGWPGPGPALALMRRHAACSLYRDPVPRAYRLASILSGTCASRTASGKSNSTRCSSGRCRFFAPGELRAVRVDIPECVYFIVSELDRPDSVGAVRLLQALSSLRTVAWSGLATSRERRASQSSIAITVTRTRPGTTAAPASRLSAGGVIRRFASVNYFYFFPIPPVCDGRVSCALRFVDSITLLLIYP